MLVGLWGTPLKPFLEKFRKKELSEWSYHFASLKFSPGRHSPKIWAGLRGTLLAFKYLYLLLVLLLSHLIFSDQNKARKKVLKRYLKMLVVFCVTFHNDEQNKTNVLVASYQWISFQGQRLICFSGAFLSIQPCCRLFCMTTPLFLLPKGRH